MAFNNAVNATDSGFQTIDTSGNWIGRTLTAGSGISITNGTGISGNPVISATGSSGIVTLMGNNGTATGSTVTITTGAFNANGTALFTGDNVSTITLSATDSNSNTGWGTSVLSSLTSGDSANCGFGYQSLAALTSGSANTCMGYDAGYALTSGGKNTLIGSIAGYNYTSSESNNIILGNNIPGTASESYICRIGNTTGSSNPGDINQCFIQGIYGQNSSGFSSPKAVWIDTSTGQLGYGTSGPFGYSAAAITVSPTAGQGNYTTIAAALSAAVSGDNILIKEGTYTENPALVAGVNLVAWNASALTPTVTIVGKCTFASAGTVSISGIQLQTNNDYCLAVTGSAASIVNLQNCYINALNHTAIDYTSSSSSSAVTLTNCQGNIGTTGIAIFTHSSAGNLTFNSCTMGNSGGSTTANTASAGALNIGSSGFGSTITCSLTNVFSFTYSGLAPKGAGLNLVALTTSGTVTGQAIQCDFEGGTASAISIGSGTTVGLYGECTVNSSNTDAITGTGTLNYNIISFTGTSSTVNVSTQNALATLPAFASGYVTTLDGDSGSATPSSGVITISGGSTGLTTSGSSHTLSLTGTLVVGNGGTGATTLTGLLTGNGTSAVTATAITQYNVITGGASNAPNSVAPSSTSGVPLISQGSSSQPAFGTVAIAGGGTNATSFTQSNGIVTYNGTRLVNYAGPQISSSGYATNSAQPAFLVYFNAGSTNDTGDGTAYNVPFDTAVFDQDSNVNLSTGTFTAPVTGKYQFNCSVFLLTIAAGTTGALRLVTTAQTYASSFFNYSAMTTVSTFPGYVGVSLSILVPMSSGDTANVQVAIYGGTKTAGVGAGVNTNFSGYLVC